jgi:hypothetical protein
MAVFGVTGILNAIMLSKRMDSKGVFVWKKCKESREIAIMAWLDHVYRRRTAGYAAEPDRKDAGISEVAMVGMLSRQYGTIKEEGINPSRFKQLIMII